MFVDLEKITQWFRDHTNNRTPNNHIVLQVLEALPPSFEEMDITPLTMVGEYEMRILDNGRCNPNCDLCVYDGECDSYDCQLSEDHEGTPGPNCPRTGTVKLWMEVKK